MKIGLISVDGHNNFPNLALMKLSAYHKLLGDNVEFVDPMFGVYDKVYMSKVFTFTPDYSHYIQCNDIVRSGTGYSDYDTVLPDHIESICPDYDLYGADYAVGFLTRGCPRNCPWCVVPKKEGGIKPNQDISSFVADKKKVVLLDNNVLASDFGLSQIEKMQSMKIRVDFNQGLDARMITKDAHIFNLLAKTRWIKFIRLACDTMAQLPHIEESVYKFKEQGIKPYKIFVYVLLQDFRDSIIRLRALKDLGVTPFAQPFLDFTGRQSPPQWQLDMARWCNHKALFQSIDFADYVPRKSFKCSYYFDFFDSVDLCAFSKVNTIGNL